MSKNMVAKMFYNEQKKQLQKEIAKLVKSPRIPRPMAFKRGRIMSRKQRLETVHHFKRIVRFSSNGTGTFPDTPSIDGTTDYNNYFTFQLSDLNKKTASYTDSLTAMYDYYRINKVVVKLIPRFTDANLTGSTDRAVPQVYSVIDYDGGSSTLTQDQLLQHQTVRITRGQKSHKRVFTPAILNSVDNATNGVPKWKQWLDMQNINTEHNGLYLYIDRLQNQDGSVPSGPGLYYDLYVTFYFSCKGLR
jgi:hypothetical protein